MKAGSRLSPVASLMKVIPMLAGIASIGCAENPVSPEFSAAVSPTTPHLAAFTATPLIDMPAGVTYLGFEGGLYPGASNTAPALHEAEGIARALSVEPLDALGNPDPAGKYVMISIGMSNTTQEFCSKAGIPPCDPGSFMDLAAADGEVNHTELVIVNGAKGGQSAEEWVDPAKLNSIVRRLDDAGVTEAQVQIAWVKVANRTPTVGLPDPAADAYVLEQRLGQIARNLYDRYPNLKQVFVSSRIYAGYAVTELNPEPYAYESGYAVKWLIEAQIDQMNGGGIDAETGDLDYTSAAPWLAWGAYMWADGLNPRSDGLTWDATDFESDGTHPSSLGVEKVGTALLTFFKSSPFTACWFTVTGSCEPIQKNTAPVAAFSWTSNKLQVQFTDTSTDADGHVVTWSWDFGDGTTSTAQHPLHPFASIGTYDVSLTVTDDIGATATTTKQVTVDVGGGNAGISLTATPVTKNGQKSIRLTWEGASGANVDVYLDGTLQETTANDGRHVIRLGTNTQTSYLTKICEAGASVCSNEETVVF